MIILFLIVANALACAINFILWTNTGSEINLGIGIFNGFVTLLMIKCFNNEGK